MPPDGNPLVTVDDDLKGPVAVGTYVLHFGSVNGGVVNEAPQPQGRNYTRHKGPVDFRPRPFFALLDRDEQIATVKLALQASRPVCLVGPAGIGKTSLLRSLAYLPEADQFPDGVVYLSVSTLGLDDVLQSLFEAFYENGANYQPTETELRNALQGIKALILLDDLILGQDETIALSKAAPDCTFVLASQEQRLLGIGEIVEIGGLPLEEAFDLFVLELNHSLDGQEQVEVREICGLLAGHSLRILQSASLVREKTVTINALKTRLQQIAPDEAVLRILLDSFTDSQKNIISILAAAGGVPVSVKHLEDLSLSAELKSDLQKLVSLGLAQTNDSKFSLAGDSPEAISKQWDLNSWEERLIEFLVDWLAKGPDQTSLSASMDLLVQAIQSADEKSRWHDVVRIGRGLESALILSRRWQSWLEVLNLILKAARALGDRQVEAWALHQIGTRAACLGPDETARGFLTQALQIRQAIGDRAGLAVTRNNLRVFFNIPLPRDARQAGTRRWITCGAIAAGLCVTVSAVVTGLFLLFSNRPVAPPGPANSTATALDVWTSTNLPGVLISPSPTTTALATFTPAQTPAPATLFNFVSEANRAVWESSETFDPNDDVFKDCDLTFGAPPLRPCGFARWEDAALEDDSVHQTVLVVEPYYSNGAQIRGTYDLTDLTLGKGDRLVTVVGFLKTAETLGVAFSVSFSTGDPDFSPVLVYETRDRNDDRLIEAVTLLPDEVIGQSGYFILQVLAAPNTDANWASWVVARLERP